MNHLIKTQSISSLVKYNKNLLIITVLLAISNIMLVIYAMQREERWLVIPTNNPEKTMSISNTTFYETYLNEWAEYVMRELFYTSPERVEKQVANLRIISSNVSSLDKFFKDHVGYIKGSSIFSTFYPKKTKIIENGVIITGTFCYWFGSSDKKISLEKSYLLNYKRANKGIILLTNIEEEKNEKQ